MATPRIIELSNAIHARLELLRIGSPVETFTIAETYVPIAAPEDLLVARAKIVPMRQAPTPWTRRQTQYQIGFDVGIQKKISKPDSGGTPTDDTQVGSLMLLVQQIMEQLNEITFSDIGAMFVSIANEPIFDSDMLHEKRIFMSVVTATYNMIADK